MIVRGFREPRRSRLDDAGSAPRTRRAKLGNLCTSSATRAMARLQPPAHPAPTTCSGTRSARTSSTTPTSMHAAAAGRAPTSG